MGMGNCVGNCVFRCGYTLYAETCIGRCIHNKYINTFRKQFGERAIHSRLTPFVFESTVSVMVSLLGSVLHIHSFNELLILPIPVLTCNYAYMVADLSVNNFVFVDVGDATLIKNVTQVPDAILTTHKHWDHSGGNRRMRATFPGLRVYGGAYEHVPDTTHSVHDGEELSFGRLKFTALMTPGHTRGHIVWRLHGAEFGVSDSIFSGDHLMLAGCGAVFEGTLKQMIASLELMAVMPNDTLVWPGHEMGLENLELASFVEPDNVGAVLKLVWAVNRRDRMLCTCPSTIGEEKLFNPFLRTKEESLWKSLGIYDKIVLASPPLTQEEIGVMCFEHIVRRSSEMRKLKQQMKYLEEKSEQPKELNGEIDSKSTGPGTFTIQATTLSQQP